MISTSRAEQGMDEYVVSNSIAGKFEYGMYDDVWQQQQRELLSDVL
jgi:hypothetical protein